MKIDRILLLACDRPDYLKQSLARIMQLGTEIVCVLDKPSKLERIEDWKKCQAILKTAGVNLIENKENLGCSMSMYKLLDQRHDGVNLIIEDDIVLKEEFENFISDKEMKSPFILRLSEYCWGWIADGLALDTFKAFRNSDNTVVDKKQMGTVEWKAIEIFQKSNTFFPFDELLDKCINFTKINQAKGFDLTTNIGEFSSRKQNKSEGVVKTALFKNGVLSKIDEI